MKRPSKQRRSKNGRRLGHTIGSVYLVHFARSFNGVRHYLGFSTNIPKRVKEHRAGRGSPLLKAVTARRIPWSVVRKWHGKDGHFEKKLKQQNALVDLCPKCRH
jgi:predicted GIY-YIG superfamily endonuclease